MNNLSRKLLGELNIACTVICAILISGMVATVSVFASGTSNFTQTIVAGTLATDIVDASYVTVGSPTMAMAQATLSYACQTITGYFGTDTQVVYVNNPSAAANGWTLSLAASATTAVWDGAATDFDFNDPTGSGCTDGADTDVVGGQMTVDPTAATGATLAEGQSANGTTGVTLGAAAAAYSEGVTDTVVIAQSSGSTDIGDWIIKNVKISQKIPAEQAVASDYDINMVLSIAAI